MAKTQWWNPSMAYSPWITVNHLFLKVIKKKLKQSSFRLYLGSKIKKATQMSGFFSSVAGDFVISTQFIRDLVAVANLA